MVKGTKCFVSLEYLFESITCLRNSDLTVNKNKRFLMRKAVSNFRNIEKLTPFVFGGKICR